MRARFACLVILAIAAGCGSAPGGPAKAAKAASPRELLETILACSQSKDYAGLKPHICAVPLGPLGVLTQDVAIQYIVEQDRTKTGDFSYSDEAMKILLKEHVGRFSAEIPDDWMEAMTNGEFSTPELRKLALDGKANFRVLDHEGVFILVANVEGRYKLAFWGGLNSLLEK